MPIGCGSLRWEHHQFRDGHHHLDSVVSQPGASYILKPMEMGASATEEQNRGGRGFPVLAQRQRNLQEQEPMITLATRWRSSVRTAARALAA